MDVPEGRTPPFATPEANRQAYLDYFRTRLGAPRAATTRSFVEEAERARQVVQAARPEMLSYRR
jgi:hypothetical protein